VLQPTLSSLVIWVLAICCASHATRVSEVAGVMGARPRPRDRLQMDPARRAAQSAQLALDHAACRAEIEVTPALDAPPVDLQLTAGLPAARADPSAPPQPDDHDDRVAGDADVADRCATQTQQPVNAAVMRTSSSW